MKFANRTLRAALSVGTAAAVSSARAFWTPTGSEIPNFDARPQGAGGAAKVQQAAVATLRTQALDFRVDFDERLGTPKWVRAERTFLSGPGAQGLTISPQTRASLQAEEHLATKGFLKEHQDLFGYGPEVLANARLKQDSVTAHNGLRTVVWQQEVDGISVFEGLLISHTTKQEELVSISSQFIPSPEKAAGNGVPG